MDGCANEGFKIELSERYVPPFEENYALWLGSNAIRHDL